MTTTSRSDPEIPLASLIERAREWAKAQPKEVRLAIRQRALDAMLREGLIGADGKVDPVMLNKFCIVEAIREMRRTPPGGQRTD